MELIYLASGEHMVPTSHIDQFHLIHETSQQQYQWTISDAVNIVKCS